MKGYFISLEGPDGAGKSTVLKEVLTKIGPKMKTQYLVTREPGGSVIAEKIRQIILDPANKKMDDKTEALLYAASRSQHVKEVIAPALASGKVVFSDRYVDSSLAYQGAGRNLGIAAVKQINEFACGGAMPELTLFFDLKPEMGLARIEKLRPDQEDRLEQEKLAFHQKVYRGYKQVIKQAGDRIVTIDATKPIEQVVEQVIQVITTRFPELFEVEK